jgi:hypothetical protein
MRILKAFCVRNRGLNPTKALVRFSKLLMLNLGLTKSSCQYKIHSRKTLCISNIAWLHAFGLQQVQ